MVARAVVFERRKTQDHVFFFVFLERKDKGMDVSRVGKINAFAVFCRFGGGQMNVAVWVSQEGKEERKVVAVAEEGLRNCIMEQSDSETDAAQRTWLNLRLRRVLRLAITLLGIAILRLGLPVLRVAAAATASIVALVCH